MSGVLSIILYMWWVYLTLTLKRKEGFKVIECGRVDCFNFDNFMVLWQIVMSKVILIRTDEILLTNLVTASF
jgi:hypothetical protein